MTADILAAVASVAVRLPLIRVFILWMKRFSSFTMDGVGAAVRTVISRVKDATNKRSNVSVKGKRELKSMFEHK